MSRRLILSLIPAISLCGTLTGMAATATAPAAPTNFTVKPLGINSFQITWKDNATNELGWEILAGIGKTTPARYALVSAADKRLTIGADKTSFILVTNDLPGKVVNFQLRAYNGAVGSELYSKKTPVVTVTTTKSKAFDDPTKLVTTALDDGRIKLTLKDNSTSETGFQIQYKEAAAKKWLTIPSDPALKFNATLSGFLPTKKYTFRVRAYRSVPLKYTAFTNEASATTKAFQAPTNLVVTPLAEGAFAFKWKDLSSIEAAYELQYKGPTDKDFVALDPYAANTTSVASVPGADLVANYQFRLRAYRFVGTTKTYTSFTSTVSAKSTALTAPTDLVSSLPTDTTVTLTWKSKSTRATGYQVQYREVGTTDFTSVSAGKVLTFKITNLVSGKLYEFKVRSNEDSDYSAFTSTVQGRTKEGFIGVMTPPIVVGNQFLYAVQTSLPGSITNLTVTGLPAGLVYNSTKRTISGTLSTAGTYTVTLTVTFADGTVSVRTLTLTSVAKEPIITQFFSVVSAPLTKTQTVSLEGKFADPDTVEAARVTTTKGVFDVILFADSTPKTVENFFKYADAKRYENSFFHRAPTDFVIQGGGFTHTTADGFKRVPTYGTVVNEPGLSNVRGTIAMAKLDNDPNSATSQFFVNVVNSTSLDSINGGFTVFGRVPTSGMAVVDSISDLPTSNYSITVDGSSVTLNDLPVDAATAPAVLDPAQLVKVTSVVDAPILTYTVLTQNASIATAVVNGTNVVITPVAKGSTTIQVTATDLDGQTVTQNIPVTVP